MKLRPLLKSKKGVSLESAVLFMTVIFTFCFLLATLALSGHYQIKIDSLIVGHNAKKEQIGEDFVAYLQVAQLPQATEDPEATQEPDGPESFAAYLEENSIAYENYSCEEVKTQDENITRYELTVLRGSDENANPVLYIKAEKTEEGQVTVLSWLPAPPETAGK